MQNWLIAISCLYDTVWLLISDIRFSMNCDDLCDTWWVMQFHSMKVNFRLQLCDSCVIFVWNYVTNRMQACGIMWKYVINLPQLCEIMWRLAFRIDVTCVFDAKINENFFILTMKIFTSTIRGICQIAFRHKSVKIFFIFADFLIIKCQILVENLYQLTELSSKHACRKVSRFTLFSEKSFTMKRFNVKDFHCERSAEIHKK